jgi:hypothetical protein
MKEQRNSGLHVVKSGTNIFGDVSKFVSESLRNFPDE